MKNVIRTALLLSAIAMASGASAQGFGLPKLPSLGGGGSGAAAVDPALVVKSLSEAVVELDLANAAYLDAFGMKKEADVARQNAESLKSGSIGVKAAIEQSATTSEEVRKLMAQKNSEKVAIEGDSKSKLGEGLLHHVSGTVLGVKGGKQLQSAIKSPQHLATLASVAQFPALLQKWASNTSNVFAYLSFNGIDVSAADAAIKKGMAE